VDKRFVDDAGGAVAELDLSAGFDQRCVVEDQRLPHPSQGGVEVADRADADVAVSRGFGDLILLELDPLPSPFESDPAVHHEDPGGALLGRKLEAGSHGFRTPQVGSNHERDALVLRDPEAGPTVQPYLT